MSMPEIWAPVVAALGASILTTVATLGILWLQRRWSSRDAAQQERTAAYAEMLAGTLPLVMRAQTAGLAGQLRSGLGEGLAVLLRQRQPLDPLEFHDWLNRDLRRINDAWCRIYIVGSQAGIDVADRLIDACSDFLGAALAYDKERSRMLRAIVGEVPSKEQTEACEEAMRRIARERVALARLARRETGRGKVIYALDRTDSALADEVKSEARLTT